jgi:hypothetical protein
MLTSKQKTLEPMTASARSRVSLHGDAWVVVTGPHPMLCRDGKLSYLLQPVSGGAAVWVAESDDPDFCICP